MKRKLKKAFFAGIVFSLLIYILSSALGAIVNVLISITFGYETYGDFVNSENTYGLILVNIFALINHALFAAITVKILDRYKNVLGDRLQWLYRCAAIAVLLYGLIVVNLITSKQPGVLTYGTHSVCILILGKIHIANLNKIAPTKQCESNRPLQNVVIRTNKKAENNDNNYCCYCGSKLELNDKYCYNCGKKITTTQDK